MGDAGSARTFQRGTFVALQHCLWEQNGSAWRSDVGQPNQTEEMVDLHIAKRLRNRRKHLGLTQLQIGTSVGVRFQQIQKYECAANRVSAARLFRLAEALEVPTAYFFEGLNVTAPDGT